MSKNVHLRAAISVSLGAIAGALCRYYISMALDLMAITVFPWGTWSVNLSGCLLMGLVTTLAASHGKFHPDVLLMVSTGFLGSYTTFSAYALDTALLLDRPGILSGAIYWLGSPLLGLLGLLIGTRLGNALSTWLTSDR